MFGTDPNAREDNVCDANVGGAITTEETSRGPQRFMHKSQQHSEVVPIFIISFDRGEYLLRAIKSYEMQDVPVDIIVHDNGSTDGRTLQVLEGLRQAGTRIYRHGAISQPEELNNVDLSVQLYRSETGYDGPYVVTDCDVDLSSASPAALRTYLELLDLFQDVECVGPMLTIADIPRSYPLFNRVMARHISQFWSRHPDWIELSTGPIAYLKHAIDTTFAVHRRASQFRRLKTGLRVYHPYEAKHLDWYLTNSEASEYRRSSSPAISHWDNVSEMAKYQSFPDQVLRYTIVAGELGSLRTVDRSTLDNPP